MPLRDVLALGNGSVVALNRLTSELLDITANGKVVAQGEVIAQEGRFALRIVSLVGEEPGPAHAMPPAPDEERSAGLAEPPAAAAVPEDMASPERSGGDPAGEAV